MAEERQYEEIEAPQQTSEAAETVQEVQSDDDGTMSLIAHLTELRSRLIKCLIAVEPSEAFFTYLKVAVVAGFLMALPIVFYQVWRFFLPALTAKERMVLGIVVPTSVVLFFSGLAFSFFLVLPAGIRFFMGFGNAELEALFSVNKYFDFVITFVLPFGFVFELPLVITILGKMGILTSAMLKKYQRIVIFLSFVAGAIITPTPDVFTQSMIALPMIVLYEVGYFIVRFILRR
ncbi:twin-arginine translocase subunit TatC [uncultured Mitsuokella sp.]|uniref:twin-arginine translocase subunit TatC n=1 Tax=uncultured Mitsuokella sp. TaxID=453120 RepID=UPI002588844A|nr:twin-arginine translocase subunit TatC [uncultured Mitsuokella sp.]